MTSATKSHIGHCAPSRITATLDKLSVHAVVCDCILWTGSVNGDGYGLIGIATREGRRKVILAHRAAYELSHGRIADGLVIDHTCRTRACVNPRHMQPVPNRVNVLRGFGPTAVNARKTHCVHGHALTPDNMLRITNRVERCCKTCNRARVNAGRARRRDADAWRGKGTPPT